MVILTCLFMASLGLLLCGEEFAKTNENVKNIHAKLKGFQATIGAVGVIFGSLGFIVAVLSLGYGMYSTISVLANGLMFAGSLPYAMPKIKEIIDNKKMVTTLGNWSTKVENNAKMVGFACFGAAILVLLISMSGPRLYM